MKNQIFPKSKNTTKFEKKEFSVLEFICALNKYKLIEECNLSYLGDMCDLIETIRYSIEDNYIYIGINQEQKFNLSLVYKSSLGINIFNSILNTLDAIKTNLDKYL